MLISKGTKVLNINSHNKNITAIYIVRRCKAGVIVIISEACSVLQLCALYTYFIESCLLDFVYHPYVLHISIFSFLLYRTVPLWPLWNMALRFINNLAKDYRYASPCVLASARSRLGSTEGSLCYNIFKSPY